MIQYDQLQHHPVSEQIVDVLRSRTQTENLLFFRVMVGYYFATAASAMHTGIKTPEGNTIPVNVFALNLAPSNFGKGRTVGVLENEVMDQFYHRFLNETFPLMAEKHLPALANQRAITHGTDPDEEYERAKREFNQLGPYVFSFDSGTAPAVKQLRHKILLAKAGSLNLQQDEVGNNLLKTTDMLDVFLELYDGRVKPKLTKNTADNVRNEDLRGITPTNMMLFGTPSRILNGGPQEDELMAMLEAGYARRCFFGYIRSNSRRTKLSPEEALKQAQATATSNSLAAISDQLHILADMVNAHRQLELPDATALLMYSYKMDCEARAEKYKEHEETLKTELESRFFKALKLAGAYAFVDNSMEITTAHYEAAMKLAEESGAALERLMNRDKPYVKLARYIADLEEEVTHADLVEDLPFYPKAQNQRMDMLNLAIAWGYKNNIIIKKSFQDGIEFLRGESLRETNLEQIRVAYSQDIAQGYVAETAPWDKLHLMTQAPGIHWINHHVRGGHRQEDNAIPGFNIVVIDVDGGVSLDTAKLLLKDYKALYYTTKRHDPKGEHRFRIILPTNYELELDAKDYKEFMQNLFEWLPFEVDAQTGQRARKWLSHAGHYEYTDGQLLDVLPFIPKTSKNEERKRQIHSQGNLDNLERWILNNTGDGNRNNMLLRYAMILVDMGHDFGEVRSKVLDLNEKLPDKLDETEIMSTIMVTVGKALSKSSH